MYIGGSYPFTGSFYSQFTKLKSCLHFLDKFLANIFKKVLIFFNLSILLGFYNYRIKQKINYLDNYILYIFLNSKILLLMSLE